MCSCMLRLYLYATFVVGGYVQRAAPNDVHVNVYVHVSIIGRVLSFGFHGVLHVARHCPSISFLVCDICMPFVHSCSADINNMHDGLFGKQHMLAWQRHLLRLLLPKSQVVLHMCMGTYTTII